VKRVLIAGCGYVGTELARSLVAENGVEVLALRRDTRALHRDTDALGSRLTPIACDLLTEVSIETKLPDDIDAVVYALGADAHTPEAYESAYVRSLDRLLQALARKRGMQPLPLRFVFVSSTAVYAQNDGKWVDELSETEPREFSGQTLLRAEALACSAGHESIVVRFGGIYGPGRTRFVDSVRQQTIRLGAGPEYTNRIHRDDCAAVLRHLLLLEAPQSLYIGVDDEPSDRREVAAWIAERVGVALEPVSTTDELSASGKRCANRRLRETGFTFRYPTFREGYAAVLEPR
jgi:nucleoside-diphosphate-sugar epimerase